MGVFEIHEAFASQMIGNVRCLASDSFCRDRLGRDGAVGEIATAIRIAPATKIVAATACRKIAPRARA